MSEADCDLVALFADEPPPPRDDAFVARVAAGVLRVRRRRVWSMSLLGLCLGLGGCTILALAAPVLAEAGAALGEAMQTPGATWIVTAAGLAIAVGVPLWRAR